MALLDFLKNKKDAEKSRLASRQSVEKKPTKKVDSVKVAKEVKSVSKSNKKTGSFSYSIIKEPHISEKGALLSETQNQYTFKVLNGFNKSEIKKSVEGVYGVKVLSVNIIKIPHKKRRIGRTQGFKKAYTKAVVKLKQGDKIEIL